MQGEMIRRTLDKKENIKSALKYMISNHTLSLSKSHFIYSIL